MSYTSSSTNQLLVDRANRLIEKHDLQVPRFISSRFLNYHFWSLVFTKIFGIKCDITLRTLNEQAEMIKSCLKSLESMIGVSLDHINPLMLLKYQIEPISDLLEIAEVWSDYFTENQDFDSFDPELENLSYTSRLSNEYQTKSEPDIYQQVNYIDSKSFDLANLLSKALKTQILAIEIEKKIKAYLGDVSSKRRNETPLRASRQSIVRTRAIQPTSSFDFQFTRSEKRNQILSVDLEKWFPEISPEVLQRIRENERGLLLLERNIILSQENQTLARLNRFLKEVVEKQHKRIEMIERDMAKSEVISRGFKRSTVANSTREKRAQRAIVQREIDQFYKEATASYLNARSHLERILVQEFRKVDTQHRQHINEIRRYLRNHDEEHMDKVRLLLANFDHFL